MKYIVIELQTNADGTVGNIVTSHDTRQAAESKYHLVLSSAAVSQLPEHAAALIDSQGGILEARCYQHEQAEPESEPEQ